jgi:hypothetical protein
MRRRSSVGPQARARALLIVLNLFALITINARPPRASAADIDIWLDAGHGGGDAGALGFDQASPYPEDRDAGGCDEGVQSPWHGRVRHVHDSLWRQLSDAVTAGRHGKRRRGKRGG